MRVFVSTALLALIALSVSVCAQPDEEESRRLAREYLEAQRDYDVTGIGTTLTDAASDIAFLDGYNPDRYMPLGEMPNLPGRGYLLVAPGAYQLDAASFCLHAGAYAPGGGDGYALAPLKGMGADLLTAILNNWREHPDVPQDRIQLLVWAIDERVDPETLAPEVQATGRLLLSDAQWQAWRAMKRADEPPTPPGVPGELLEEMAAEIGAIYNPSKIQECQDRIAALIARMGEAVNDPDEMERISAEMDAVVAEMERMQAEAGAVYERMEAELAPMLRAQEIISEEMEAMFAPMGDPVPPEGSRVIPTTRWSYAPAGFFVRYIPISGYKRTLVQVALPAPYTVARDAEGRITTVTGQDGARFRIAYDGSPQPVPGQPGLRRAAIASVVQEGAGGAAEWGSGWTLLGSTPPDGDLPTDLDERPARLREFRAALDRICAAVAQSAGRPAPEPLSDARVADALDLASLCDAVGALSGFSPVTDPLLYWNEEGVTSEAPWMEPLYEAVQSAIRDAVVTATGPPAGAVLATRRGSPEGPFVRVSAAASAASGGAAFNAAGGVAQPGNTGRQRLGIAPGQSPSSGDKEVLRKAMEGIEIIQDLLSIANGVMDPAGWLMEKVGLGTSIPGMLFDQLIKMIFEMAVQISKALGGDPPRPDYNTFDLPSDIVLPPIDPGVISDERRAAAQAVLDLMLAWFSDARRAQICLDRLGGAAQAKDEEWVWAQARAVVHYKRLTGVRMIAAADAIERLNEVFANEGVESPEFTEEEKTVALEAARSGELTDLDRQAARLLGLSEEEVKAGRASRAGAEESPALGARYVEALAELPEPLRAAGEVWSRLPEVPPPGVSDADLTADASPEP